MRKEWRLIGFAYLLEVSKRPIDEHPDAHFDAFVLVFKIACALRERIARRASEGFSKERPRRAVLTHQCVSCSSGTRDAKRAERARSRRASRQIRDKVAFVMPTH